MKTLLVPVEPNAQSASTLRAACHFARAFDAVLEGVFLRPAFMQPLGVEPASAILVSDAPVDDPASRQEAAAAFAQAATATGLEMASGVPTAGPCAVWNDEMVADDDFIGRYGRAFDLTVVGRPNDRGGGPRLATLEASLFDSGRPILIAPPEAQETFGSRIAIAWNGSTETARTVAFALPLLRRAHSVVVLAGSDERPGPSGPQVLTHLSRNGIAADLSLMSAANIRSGDAILSEAQKLGCDLLVKGAYTQSRLRQMIFGGATNSIIAGTTMPVFMAH